MKVIEMVQSLSVTTILINIYCKSFYLRVIPYQRGRHRQLGDYEEEFNVQFVRGLKVQ